MLEKEITNATDQIDQVGVAFRSRPGVVVPQRTTPAPRVGAVHLARTRPELASRLVREKEHTRLGDSSERQRRGSAWVPVDKEYRFDTGDGEKTLPSCSTGAPSCSSITSCSARATWPLFWPTVPFSTLRPS